MVELSETLHLWIIRVVKRVDGVTIEAHADLFLDVQGTKGAN